MIQWVYEGAGKALSTIYVATDDRRISEAVEAFGGKVVMTSQSHRSGTDRCMEALDKIRKIEKDNWDVVINVQGDEPFISGEQIRLLQSCFDDAETDIATLIKRIDEPDEIFDENKPKVVFDQRKFALFFSRSPIPFVRGSQKETWLSKVSFYRHIGIYAYRSEVLKKLAGLSPSGLEKAESLEQLRWLENGFRIKIEFTDYGPLGVDTPEDLERTIESMNES